MTGEQISVLAGIVLSLAFSYAPGLREWYEPLDGTHKRLIMLFALLLVIAGTTALSCLKITVVVDCTQAGITELFWNFIAAAIANQMAHRLSPPIGGNTLPPEHRKP